MAPQHNPSYCGVCRVWVSGLSRHQQSKAHLRLYEPFRQRIVAHRVEQRRINLAAAETVPPLL